MKMAADAIERSEGAVWSGIQRVLARFLFCYFVLYYGPTLLGAVPGAGFLLGWSSLLRYKLVGLVMVHVIGLDSYQPQFTGSGDTAASYVIQIIILVAAFGGRWSGACSSGAGRARFGCEYGCRCWHAMRWRFR
jgi:hypothetical protein